MPNGHIEHWEGKNNYYNYNWFCCEGTTKLYSVANATNGFDAVIMRLTLTSVQSKSSFVSIFFSIQFNS